MTNDGNAARQFFHFERIWKETQPARIAVRSVVCCPCLLLPIFVSSAVCSRVSPFLSPSSLKTPPPSPHVSSVCSHFPSLTFYWSTVVLQCCVSFYCTAKWISSVYTYIRRRQWHPTPVLLPGKFHGQRSLVGCSPWGREESDRTERLHFHFSLSCIGKGNSNPLRCPCLENPRDGGAWWADVYGVA